MSQNPKTHPRIQNMSQNPEYVPESKTLPRIQKCFGIWEVFWILGCVFGFLGWVLDSCKCSEILGRVLDSGKCFVPMSHSEFGCFL